jgi:hypothetical protein
MKTFTFALAACTVFALLPAALLLGAPEQSPPPAVEDLGDRLLGDWEFPAATNDSARPKTTTPNVDESRKLLESPKPQEPAGEDIGKQGTSPLERISNRMERAHRLIASQTTDGQTKKVQESIVEDLDQLIEELSKQCKSCSSGQCDKPPQKQQTADSAPKPGQGKKPGSPTEGQGVAAQQSQAPAGGGKPANPGELSDEELVKQLWGQLPQHMRQQLLQSSADEFLPKYRAELEEYFRKLSEEQGGEPGAR